MTDQTQTEGKEFPDPRKKQLDKLHKDLSIRANQLVAQDPQGCRILGKIELLQEQLGSGSEVTPDEVRDE